MTASRAHDSGVPSAAAQFDLNPHVRAPHPATVVQPKTALAPVAGRAPHPAKSGVDQRDRPSHPATVAQSKTLHVAQREKAERGFGAVQPRAAPRSTTRGALQMRGSNPYAAGGGLTSHHIIPHSVLVKNKDLLTIPQQIRVMGLFLPAFDTLTVERLLKAAITDDIGDPLEIAYNGQARSLAHVVNDNPGGFRAVAQTTFGALALLEQQTLRFDGVTFANFRTRYEDLQQNLVAAPTEKETGMLEAFFEWQSGNQFYGPDRYEPGTKDEFDDDARHVLANNVYVNGLKRIYGRLKPNQLALALNAQERLDVIAQLEDLAGLGTVGRLIPADDNAHWSALATDEKQALLALLEGYDRVAASGDLGPRANYKMVHKDIIRKAMGAQKSKNNKNAAHAVLTMMNHPNPNAGPCPHSIYGGWQLKRNGSHGLKIQNVGEEHTTVSVAKGGGKFTMNEVHDALDELFVDRVTHLFGL